MMATCITSKSFGQTASGEETKLYVLKSPVLEIGVTDYGATITSIKQLDKQGEVDDIVTGFDSVKGYEDYPNYFGASVGRCANRIANGTFVLDGVTYHLPINDGPNSLHGGIRGFDKIVWNGEIEGDDTVAFRLQSPDGDQGYPGSLDATARFTLKGAELMIQYCATTDKPTIVNMTNHSYFNLAGHSNWKEIYDHKVEINADHITPVTESLIPTGEIRDVTDTVFDLRKPQLMTKERLYGVPGGGYDHNFCLALNGQRRLAARVEHEPSGRVMTVETTQPGVQFYTANSLNGVPSKNGGTYDKHSCFCLETQCYPDAINHENFPSPVLRPDEVYDYKTWFTFSVMKSPSCGSDFQI